MNTTTAIIICILAFISGCWFLYRWLKYEKPMQAIAALILLVFGICIIVPQIIFGNTESTKTEVPETYFSDAVVAGYKYEENNCITLFENNDRIFKVNSFYKDDGVYMLTIISNNTSDTKDDEVAVVWTAKEEALS